MSEPQAESAPWWPHFVTFCERDCSPGARSYAFYQRIYADAWEVAYLAGQLAMRERCAKVCDERASQCAEAIANSIDGDMESRYRARHETARHLADRLRALSPEEHRT